MNKKKIVTVSGALLFPVQIGYNAVIIRCGNLIRTSKVIDVIESNDNYVIFETMNSIYYVSMNTMPNTAALSTSVAMCA